MTWLLKADIGQAIVGGRERDLWCEYDLSTFVISIYLSIYLSTCMYL
jgi:hypothetical protein